MIADVSPGGLRLAFSVGPWLIDAFQASGDTEALAEIQDLRARVLYDNGRRPSFRHTDGRHTDPQDLDHDAWHFLARREPGARPLGYVRLAMPRATARFQSREYLGDQAYDALLTEHGLPAGRVFEHSRLVVEHRARKLGLGIHLNAVAIAAAHALGAAAMTGTSGTKDGQDRFHERFGFRAVPGTRRYVERYTEDVVLMMQRTAEGAGEYTDLIARLAAEFASLCIGPPETAEHTGGILPRQVPRESSGTPAALRGREPDLRSWRPTLLTPSDPGDRTALEALLASGVIREVHDTIEDQIGELISSRDPKTVPDPTQRAEQLAGLAAWEYGTWVHYPWSARLVHVLPREEFRLVRTDRNRGKIERPEQRRLLGRTIGVAGLSVGNSAAVTLALEGIGGRFRLADFDDFGLSNLNRLRAGVADLAVNKTVLTARQLFEIDPYLDIEIFPDGLHEGNLADFVDGLDLLVEECDSPHVKIAARERARLLGVPVVMDCNDRGMLDVERFDLEPARPLLHGRIRITAQEAAGLSRDERIALILDMVDLDRISPELRASIAELGRTLSSWPQLASGVALGGALVTDAARRILLGGDCPSGRYYTDFTELLAAARDTSGMPRDAAGNRRPDLETAA
ncbi:ubiquitin activation protein [Actinorhabdospora filicis]|uniref:Ubiquitin activation protein n=1 Tax=Actinorhabdospora filicis TaxID=1785913 RepID=A0A9W6SM72_9ACTN|nr:ThiF family adenylyltransferase [Actinorhabdospora filicis]GLZ78477.1 ubiquitin activation protein [Actinorhabdospora filicis]